jgi:photosystem II stability/assembly factor-like uncharacterized protein
LYAATSSGGVYKSTDNAANWTAINSGYAGLNFRTFAFQPGNTGVVLGGSADPSNIGAAYRSTDGGLNWVRSSNGMNAGALRGMAFSPTNADLVIAAGFKQANTGGEESRGLWRSTDAGQNWTKIDDPGLNFVDDRIVVFDPNDGNKVLSTSPRRLNLSSDAGLTWQNSFANAGNFGGLPSFANISNLSLLGVAAGPKAGGGTRFYASVLSTLPPGSPLPTFCQNNPGVPCSGGVYFSDDGGFHWTYATGLDSASYLSIGATPGTVFASQTNQNGYVGGVYKSTDFGATWSDSSGGLPCRYVFSVAADPLDASIVWTGCVFTDITAPGGIFRSNNGGASWVPYGRGLRSPAIAWLTPDPVSSGHVLAGGAEGIHEMHFAPDADQDGIPDSEEAAVAANGDANQDSTPDASQANVASTGTTAAAFATSRATATAAGNYVVVEVENAAPVDNGKCLFVSDLVVVPPEDVPSLAAQAAPTVRFILPDCQQATVKIRYTGVMAYSVGVFGSYSPAVAGDASTIRWGLFAANEASVDNNGLWTLHLDENSYGNIYAQNTGSISFQGAPGNDRIFAGNFE